MGALCANQCLRTGVAPMASEVASPSQRLWLRIAELVFSPVTFLCITAAVFALALVTVLAVLALLIGIILIHIAS